MLATTARREARATRRPPLHVGEVESPAHLASTACGRFPGCNQPTALRRSPIEDWRVVLRVEAASAGAARSQSRYRHAEAAALDALHLTCGVRAGQRARFLTTA